MLEHQLALVDIGALHRRFPAIAWHRFSDWASQRRARLAGLSGTSAAVAGQ